MRRLLVSLLLTIALVGASWLIWERIGHLSDEAVVDTTTQAPVPTVLQPPDSIATAPFPGFLAPDFSLRSYIGSEVQLSDSLGKPTIVTFWQGQCLFCLSQLQTLTTLARNNPDLVVLAINRKDDTADTEHVHEVLQSPRNFSLLFDPNDIQFGRYRGEAMPTTFFIDRRGVIIERAEQEVTALELEEIKLKLE